MKDSAESTRRSERWRSLLLLRALVPSWRFFVAESPALHLWVRTGSADAPGQWMRVDQNVKRPWYALFFNPLGQHTLALVSVMEQALTQDDATVACSLLEHASQAHVRALGHAQSGAIQFKVVGTEPDGTVEDRITSSWVDIESW